MILEGRGKGGQFLEKNSGTDSCESECRVRRAKGIQALDGVRAEDCDDIWILLSPVIFPAGSRTYQLVGERRKYLGCQLVGLWDNGQGGMPASRQENRARTHKEVDARTRRNTFVN